VEAKLRALTRAHAHTRLDPKEQVAERGSINDLHISRSSRVITPTKKPLLNRIRRTLSSFGRISPLLNKSAEPETPWRAEVLSREALAELALQLAEQHRGTFGPSGSIRLLQSYKSNRETLKRVYQSLADAAHRGEALTAGAEWMLDNYHVVERHIAMIKKYLPWGFYRTLPKFKQGNLKGFPRVYHLALEFIVHTDAVVDANLAAVFLSAYQERLELSSGELWAFPIMLRFALFENLRRLTREAEKELLARRDVFSLVDSVLGDESKPGTEIMNELARKISERETFLPHGALELIKRLRMRGRKAFLALQFIEETLRERGLDYEDLQRAQDHTQAARQISVGNTLTSLTAIDQMNWRDWFETVSLADKLLRQDPARIYPRCDFTTRDRIRHDVEHLAKKLNITDSAIAAAALACAETANLTHPGEDNESLCKKYVGSFFIDEGRGTLERKLGYTPNVGVRIGRFLQSHAVASYLTAIFLTSFMLVLYVVLISEWAEVSFWVGLATVAIAFLPMSELASSLVQYLVTRSVTPRPLPKLSFEEKVPEGLDTLVTVHTIFSNTSSIQKSIDGLEVRFLANEDPAFTYILMADLPDASSEDTPIDEEIIGIAKDGIETLNIRHASPGKPRFCLFFRRRLWNPSENRWMAWERKRGKIEELHRFLLGDDNTTLQLIVGDASQLRKTRYIITLDSDSQLSRDVAKKLVATIAHPLNQAVIDPSINRVVKGYGLIQPRVTISLTSATSSWFSRLFSGQAGLDPYTNVVSDVYQDLFAEGSYVGKGIYDVKAFEKVMEGRVPENTLLSHDLFEGSFARVGLASDIELYDDFPSRYMAYSKRLHRWVRGDWQLLPWLLPRWVSGNRIPKSNLSALARWKMIDNLRRSLLAPTSLAALIGGWLFLPGGPLTWTVLVLLVISFPVFTGLASVFALPTVGISLGGFLGDIGVDLWRQTIRSLCAICFLPHQAALMIHAIGVTLKRVFITKNHLLEWEPAERSEQKAKKNEIRMYMQLFAPVMSIIYALAIFAALVDVSSLSYSLPFLALWTCSPFIARRISQPLEVIMAPASPGEVHYLKEAAFDTWLFFNHHMREEYNYLMPDNLQMIPNEVVAERTSPTNISLSLLTIFSAYDLGFMPFHRAIHRASLPMRTIAAMEKYRGHLFNWYAIRTLAPLSPRYISTVDSGNMLGHFYTMRTILEQSHNTPLVSDAHRNALVARIEAVLRDKSSVEKGEAELLSALHQEIRAVRPGDTLAWLSVIFTHEASLAEIAKRHAHDAPDRGSAAQKLSAALDDLLHFKPLYQWIRELKSWEMETNSSRASAIMKAAERAQFTLHSLHILFEQVDAMIVAESDSATASLEGVAQSLGQARAAVAGCENTISSMEEQLTTLINEMDFSFLYDEYRSLFTIGFNAEHARRDASYYDLLASEARLLSFLAVARGEVPQKHWFSLGRSLASTPGGKALVSWSGTMFEYLMPFLVMRDFPTTILGRTGRAIVEAQIHYGERQAVPWGISESAYSGVDFEKTYQYRAFGVPGLGLKRGLSEDLVVSPYSTFLALPFTQTPEACVSNLKRLENEGARGIYGFYEAVDYTPSRSLRTEGKHIVQSFFAHHQGMSVVSINNVLNADVMVDRFHAQPVVKSAELLLHEKFPERVAAIKPHAPELTTLITEEAPKEAPGLEVITSPHTIAPRVRVLSNGRYSVMVDSSGGGFSAYQKKTILTRWREDPTTTSQGSFIYIQDRKSGSLWSTAYQPSRKEPDSYEAIFSPGRAEFKRFDDKIFVHTEITVAPEDDVELRRVTITNLGDTERELELTSYIEPVLLSRQGDSAHPAFSKLFIRAEILKDSDAILCSRRPRTESEEELFLFHRVTLKTSYAPIKFETSRDSFIGRGGSMRNPARFSAPQAPAHAEASNIDPIASLGCKVRLESGASETLVFITGAAKTRREAMSLIERYQELLHVSRAFELSWSRAQIELRSHAYTATQADLFHRLAGALMYNEHSVRGTAESMVANRLSQSALWRFGISGDLPIVLLRMSDSRQTRAAQELLLAHHFLRERGIEFDLVVLYKSEGSYLQNLAEELKDVVRLSPAGQLLDRPGGVFLRSTGQISEGEIALLETVCRILIDADIGSLSDTLKTSAFDQVVAPPPVAPRKRAQGLLPTPPPLIFENGLGGFSPDTNHYVLPIVGSKRPPLPWVNVISNPSFGFIVTESGSGYTWSDNSRENRLTSWSNDPILDPPSEAVYLRRSEHGDYWSLTPAPAGDGLDYSVEHGFGSSTFQTTNHGISTKLTISGARQEKVKWYSVTLANNEGTEQKLELYFYADLVLGVTRENSYRYVTTTFDRTAQVLCAQNHYNNEFAGRVVALGSSEPIVSFSASRLEFLGRNGDLSRPAALERGAQVSFFPAKPKPIKLTGKVGAGIDPCGLIHISVVLKPREEKNLHFFLAEASTMEHMRTDAQRFRSLQTQRVELNAVESSWNELLHTVQVKTPSAAFDVMMNGWLLYQTLSCRLMGRSAFYQSGGALGFRDQLQDSLALLPSRPDAVRSQIILHAAHQFVEGDVQHWWHPPTGRGVRTRISDDLLWLPYAVSRYIESTGDYSILNKEVSFLRGAPLGDEQMETYFIPDLNGASGTILEHCLRTFQVTAAVGEHGLPLIGGGDWNDGMNEVGRHGRGESVWLAWFQIEVIRRFTPILEAQGDHETAMTLLQRAERLRDAVEKHGWDGEWYRRAFFDDGSPLGSHTNDECKIDSLAQSWALISGAGSPERTNQAMRSVREHLIDREGKLIKLLTPPFNHSERNPGYIQGYPPGVRENGGQYTHASAWVIIATALAGHGNEALELFELINPINHTSDPQGVSMYQAEPYVLCGDVYSEGALRGRAGWSWYTGSSGWMYQAGLEYIVGLKIHPNHFTVDPVIPSSWPEFTLTYRRNNKTFVIEVINEGGVEHGVSSISINGKASATRDIPYEDPTYGAIVSVRVILASAEKAPIAVN
jgi:cyclic beta-1,2-glucan synthetase